jgi:hypothetical protein
MMKCTQEDKSLLTTQQTTLYTSNFRSESTVTGRLNQYVLTMVLFPNPIYLTMTLDSLLMPLSYILKISANTFALLEQAPTITMVMPNEPFEL